MVKSKKVSKISPSKKSNFHFPTTFEDFKSATLLVSLTINVVVLIAWLTIKVTSKYDDQVAAFLFNR